MFMTQSGSRYSRMDAGSTLSLLVRNFIRFSSSASNYERGCSLKIGLQQVVVSAAPCGQLIRGAHLHEPSIVQHNQAIHGAHGGEAVRDDKGCPPDRMLRDCV